MSETSPRTALVSIDMQLALTEGAFQIASVIEHLAALQQRCRRGGVPVVHVQHNHDHYQPLSKGAAGWAIHPTLAPYPHELVIEKRASDAFYGTELEERLRGLGVGHLLVGGMQTEYCVDTTVRAALSRGFEVTLLADCHTTGDSHLGAAEIIAHHNAVLGSLAHPDHSVHVRPSTEVTFRT